MISEYLLWILVALAGYQLFVSVRVLFSQSYTTTQKAIQLLMIWLLPLLGSVLCHMFLSTDGKHTKKKETAFTRDEGKNPMGMLGERHDL
jgi:formate/nitrite transporter FocA (FNT family)